MLNQNDFALTIYFFINIYSETFHKALISMKINLPSLVKIDI